MHCRCPEDCCSELARLREENLALRLSAETFGDLAERLNDRLRERKAVAPGVPWDAVSPFAQLAGACRQAVTELIRAALRRGHPLLSARARR